MSETCNVQELLSESNCFGAQCCTQTEQMQILLALLCQISQGGGGGGGVTEILAGLGISVDAATGNVTVTNTGVLSNIAGTGVSVDQASGDVTITNTGVTSIIAGSGVSVDQATGDVTVSAGGSSDIYWPDGSTVANIQFNNLTVGTPVDVVAFFTGLSGQTALILSDINAGKTIEYEFVIFLFSQPSAGQVTQSDVTVMLGSKTTGSGDAPGFQVVSDGIIADAIIQSRIACKISIYTDGSSGGSRASVLCSTDQSQDGNISLVPVYPTSSPAWDGKLWIKLNSFSGSVAVNNNLIFYGMKISTK